MVEREMVKGMEGIGGEAVGDGFNQNTFYTCVVLPDNKWKYISKAFLKGSEGCDW